VGEAILRAARFLPTMVGIVILTYLALFLLVMVLAIIGAVLGAIIGTAGGVLLVLGLLAVICVVVTKLSLTLPAMVMENQLNPVAAMTRSWRLTTGNTLRLLGFYALLFIAYMIVAVIIMVVIGAITALFSGGGTAGQGTLIVTGLVSGAISAAVAVLFNGVLAANYRQLSGNSGDQIEETFR
jgi:predicted Co/Zn/Cd cation transporter (cation efflux family)